MGRGTPLSSWDIEYHFDRQERGAEERAKRMPSATPDELILDKVQSLTLIENLYRTTEEALGVRLGLELSGRPSAIFSVNNSEMSDKNVEAAVPEINKKLREAGLTSVYAEACFGYDGGDSTTPLVGIGYTDRAKALEELKHTKTDISETISTYSYAGISAREKKLRESLRAQERLKELERLKEQKRLEAQEKLKEFGTGINHPYLSPAMTPLQYAAAPGVWVVQRMKKERSGLLDSDKVPLIGIGSLLGAFGGIMGGGAVSLELLMESTSKALRMAGLLGAAAVGGGVGWVVGPVVLAAGITVLGGVAGMAAGLVLGPIDSFREIKRYRRALKQAGAVPQLEGQKKKPQPKKTKSRKAKNKKAPQPEQAHNVTAEAFINFFQAFAAVFARPTEETAELHMQAALLANNPRKLEKAIKAGAPASNVMEIGDFTGSAPAFCAEYGFTKMQRVLMSHGVDPNNPADKPSALERAVKNHSHIDSMVLAASGAKVTPEIIELARSTGQLSTRDMLEAQVEVSDSQRGTERKWQDLEAASSSPLPSRRDLTQAFSSSGRTRVAPVEANDDIAPVPERPSAAMRMRG